MIARLTLSNINVIIILFSQTKNINYFASLVGWTVCISKLFLAGASKHPIPKDSKQEPIAPVKNKFNNLNIYLQLYYKYSINFMKF